MWETQHVEPESAVVVRGMKFMQVCVGVEGIYVLGGRGGEGFQGKERVVRGMKFMQVRLHVPEGRFTL